MLTFPAKTMKISSISIGAFSFSLLIAASLTGCLPGGGTLDQTDGGAGSGGGSGGSAGGSGGSGSGGTGSSACGGSSGTSPNANFAFVKTLISNTCAGADCHEQGGNYQPYLIGMSGPFSDAELHMKLTTLTSQKCGGRVLVKPCEPDASAFYLVQKPGDACGTGAFRMPFACIDSPDALTRCTLADELEAIRQWIANGATMQ